MEKRHFIQRNCTAEMFVCEVTTNGSHAHAVRLQQHCNQIMLNVFMRGCAFVCRSAENLLLTTHIRFLRTNVWCDLWHSCAQMHAEHARQFSLNQLKVESNLVFLCFSVHSRFFSVAVLFVFEIF